MRAVLGIGNPGKDYLNTRHNIGFMVLDRFAEKNGLKFTAGKGDYFYADGTFGASRFVVIKPTTYVNLSGKAAKHVLEHYGILPEDMLVVTDDINLDLGKIRIRKSGGDGGHNGLYSIIYDLFTMEFPRLRFGIWDESYRDNMKDFVLSPFSDKDLDFMNENIEIACNLVEEFLKGGTLQMNNLFSKVSQPKKDVSNNQLKE